MSTIIRQGSRQKCCVLHSELTQSLSSQVPPVSLGRQAAHVLLVFGLQAQGCLIQLWLADVLHTLEALHLWDRIGQDHTSVTVVWGKEGPAHLDNP